MARPSRLALPTDDYLTLIGQLVYTVSDLEGTVLGDLPGLAGALPDNLTVETLAGRTTGQIAIRLAGAVHSITQPEVRAYIAEVAAALDALVSRRNDVMHARPATGADGTSVLYRWLGGDKAKAQAITTAVLELILADAEHWIDRVRPLRSAAQAAANSPL